jgi:uncharacterized protein (DUF697 family)
MFASIVKAVIGVGFMHVANQVVKCNVVIRVNGEPVKAGTAEAIGVSVGVVGAVLVASTVRDVLR